MRNDTVITDQRAQVRPIAFVLDNAGEIQDPVILPIRPQDLTRTEPTRATVHQTLGRYVSGWVDSFGAGLPSCNISGHTGWGAGGRPDGWNSFEELNNLVAKEFHAAKQEAINNGDDPADVKLLFIDMLDDFAWNVIPTQFVLRRSKSSPLLFQYNISLQAVSTSIDNSIVTPPFRGNKSAGLKSLSGSISKLQSFIGKIKGLIESVVGFIKGVIGPIADTIKGFVKLATTVFNAVSDVVNSIKSAVSSVTNDIIGIAKDLASVGTNIFKTISAIASLPSSIKAELSQIGAAFNEVACIFKNSLRPAEVYGEYSGLYGASNCSSTTGGNAASAYADKNAFDLMRPAPAPVTMDKSAMESTKSINQSDPVLAPMPIQEINRHVGIINSGISV